MKREEMIMNISREYFANRFDDNMESMFNAYQKKEKELFDSFNRDMNLLFTKAAAMQKSGVKGKIKYISITYLTSSRITGSFQFRIDLYDDLFYLDKCETCIYWCPNFLFSIYKQNIMELSAYIKSKIPRVQKHEIESISAEYVKDYYALVIVFLKRWCSTLPRIDSMDNLEWKDDPQLLYGGYMDYFHVIYPEKQGE